MAKITAQQITNDEKKVIHELQGYSNESIDKIAKRCGFSRQKVWRIIKKLESNQTIWGYNAIVNNQHLHLKNYILLVKKTNKPIATIVDIIISRDIEKSAKELNVNIHTSVYLHGLYDWILMFSAEDIKQAKKFSDHFNRIYQDYVSELFLLEEIFPVKLCDIQNPNIEQLKEFM